eukprot:CAMPEP_0198505464 /NCGR_PEP_ID=MMETSP1462-20131121/11035_1 /TAXON_ID=1333877 /ORGANISM="Brandtodinium nutriculum, Strain RCC3387" /LENGTH=263 /DNA_ID=CAMNT_0044234641 /DNA_START=23 /DNA_END=810 /DNA_ORIENTATION=-
MVTNFKVLLYVFASAHAEHLQNTEYHQGATVINDTTPMPQDKNSQTNETIEWGKRVDEEAVVKPGEVLEKGGDSILRALAARDLGDIGTHQASAALSPVLGREQNDIVKGTAQETLHKTDNIDRCRLVVESDGGLDKTIPPKITITEVPPSVTGFPAWTRQESHRENGTDPHRGHADWVVPDGADNTTPRILYCHGGGYELYSPQDIYRPATSRLAAVSGMPVLAFDYRLAPEFRHPAQLDDALQAFKWIAANGPRGPGKASA